MGVEAVVIFDRANAWEFELRRKRGAQLFSKHRYLSAQMAAYLRDDLWLTTARAANANMARLAEGLRQIPEAELVYDPAVNMAFVKLPRALLQHLKAEGAVFNVWQGDLDTGAPDEPLMARFVTDWSLPEAEIDRFLTLLTS